MMRIKNRLGKNFLIFLIGRFGAKAMVFFMLPLYTSVLTTSQYGDIDIITSTAGLLIPIATLGMSEAIFRFTMSGEYGGEQVLSAGLLSAMGAFLLMATGGRLLNQFFKWDFMMEMLVLLAANIIYEFITNYVKAEGKSVDFVMIGLAQTLTALMLNILFLVFWNLEIRGYVWAYVLSYIIPVSYVIIREKIYKKISVRFFKARVFCEMLRYSFPLIFSSLSWWIIMASDRYMIRYFLGSGLVGIYSVASKIPSIMQTVVALLQTSCQITVNELYDKAPEQLADFFNRFSEFCRGCGFICGSILILLCQPAMMILAKKDFYSGWMYVPFLCLSVVFSMASGLVSTLYGAHKRNQGALNATVLGAMMNIFMNLLLIPRIGVTGATIATAVSRLAITIYNLLDTRRFLDFNRGYGGIFINGCVLTGQSLCLMYAGSYKYILQAFFLVTILALNIPTLKWIRSVMAEKITPSKTYNRRES